MRTLAIGDIHGCLTALDRLLAEVRPQPDDLVITLGDYVDRGPDSKGVLDRLIALGQMCRLVPLRGNHDFTMVEAYKQFSHRQNWRNLKAGWLPTDDEVISSEEKEWLLMGGRQTLESYASSGGTGKLSDVPVAHWEFLEKSCRDWYETDSHLFVHANAYPDVAMSEQPTYMLHWEMMTAPRAHESGKVLICGHTSQKSGKPRNWGHTICIDTWVYGKGWLTCLDVHSGQYWQANQAGERNVSMLGWPHG
jgi:serine/threonine protein phosphatase 1